MSDTIPIYTYDDAVPPELLEGVQSEIDARGFKYGWRSHQGKGFAHWSCVFAGYARLNRDEIFEQLPPPLQALWEFVRATYVPGAKVIRAYANAYTFGTEGFIHTDSAVPSDLTFLFYLNQKWDRDWAGETLFFDGDAVIAASLPKYNRMVIFPSVVDHVARAVSRICPEQRTIFTFKARLE